MGTFKSIFCSSILVVLFPAIVFAQAFGEYGRAVGSIPHGQSITGTGKSGGVSQGSGNHSGGGMVGESRVPSLPSRLVVAVNDAALYLRQDEESQKLEQLSQGEILTPMVQSAGGDDWFMVKTGKGVIGWIKSRNVRAEKKTKQH
jgi:hypothetical protein